ncbi:MAG: pyridoxamine 5'-phosphate oxidase family protein [Burkholderiaceae bacterium]|jgi:pyridoxamine 5'-phosphate oxidase
MTARLQELDEIEMSIWSELESCVATRQRSTPGEPEASRPPHEWRVAVLATVDDGQADARSLVLREVDAAERRLVFYTDARSPKVRQIEQSPQGTLIFYSRELGWQLRMQVRLNVETAGLAVSSRWAKLQTSAGARDYQSVEAPGRPLDAPLSELGVRSHFAMIEAMAETVDWLELHPDGHRRAVMGAKGSRWVQP